MGGWLPRFDRCVVLRRGAGGESSFFRSAAAGLYCENCRLPGMKPMHVGPGILLKDSLASGWIESQTVKE